MGMMALASLFGWIGTAPVLIYEKGEKEQREKERREKERREKERRDKEKRDEE